jgi:thioredoxin-related protein
MHRDEGLPVVQVDLQGDMAVIDVQGRASMHRDVARTWGVKLAPTVLFLDPKGTEIAERLVGGMLPDFYGAYLDERLLSARAALKR